MVSSDRFQDVIKRGGFQKHQVDELDVGEVGHELHSDTHLSGEAEVLQQDGHSCGREAPADTNSKDDLGIDFLRNIFLGHIREVIGGKGYGPIHHNDFIFCLGKGADLIDTEGFVSKGEACETEGVEERGTIDR